MTTATCSSVRWRRVRPSSIIRRIDQLADVRRQRRSPPQTCDKRVTRVAVFSRAAIVSVVGADHRHNDDDDDDDNSTATAAAAVATMTAGFFSFVLQITFACRPGPEIARASSDDVALITTRERQIACVPLSLRSLARRNEIRNRRTCARARARARRSSCRFHRRRHRANHTAARAAPVSRSRLDRENWPL